MPPMSFTFLRKMGTRMRAIMRLGGGRRMRVVIKNVNFSQLKITCQISQFSNCRITFLDRLIVGRSQNFILVYNLHTNHGEQCI